MKILIGVVAFTLGITALANATPITVDLAGTVTSSFSFSSDIWPIGTDVSAHLTFDVGPGLPLVAGMTAQSGGAEWSIGAVPHSLTVQSGPGGFTFLSSSGAYTLELPASSLTDPHILGIAINGNLGTNPFTTSTSAYDLLLGSVITGFGLEAARPEGGFILGFTSAGLVGDPRFDIAPTATVPEPASLVLLGTGLVVAARRRLHGPRG